VYITFLHNRLLIGYNPAGQKPFQSQGNNGKEIVEWLLLYRYFADFEHVLLEGKKREFKPLHPNL